VTETDLLSNEAKVMHVQWVLLGQSKDRSPSLNSWSAPGGSRTPDPRIRSSFRA